jgi:hypothetical protein
MKKKYADMDPMEEIRAIREEISAEFKSVSAYGEYLQEKYSNGTKPKRSLSADRQVKVTPVKSRKSKGTKKPMKQQKTVKV